MRSPEFRLSTFEDLVDSLGGRIDQVVAERAALLDAAQTARTFLGGVTWETAAKADDAALLLARLDAAIALTEGVGR